MVLCLGGAAIAQAEEPRPNTDPPFNTIHAVEMAGATQPHLAIDESGIVHLVYGVSDTGAMYCLSSKNGGASFSPPILIAQIPDLMVGMRAGPRIAVTTKSIIVMAGGGPSKNFMAWRSTDGGTTWGQPVTLNTVESPGNEGLHDLAAHKDNALAVWLDMRNDAASLYSARSLDGGKTWSEQLLYQSPSGSICECCHPSVSFSPKGTAYVMWRNHLEGKRDMHLLTSKDGGHTWDQAVKLGEDTWVLHACPMAGGAIAAFDDKPPTTIWRRKGTIYVSEPGKRELMLGEGSDPWIAPGPGGWYAVWKNSDGRIGMASEKGGAWYEGGIPLRPTITVAQEGGYPVIAGRPNGPVITAWETEDGIFATRLDPTKKPKK